MVKDVYEELRELLDQITIGWPNRIRRWRGCRGEDEDQCYAPGEKANSCYGFWRPWPRVSKRTSY